MLLIKFYKITSKRSYEHYLFCKKNYDDYNTLIRNAHHDELAELDKDMSEWINERYIKGYDPYNDKNIVGFTHRLDKIYTDREKQVLDMYRDELCLSKLKCCVEEVPELRTYNNYPIAQWMYSKSPDKMKIRMVESSRRSRKKIKVLDGGFVILTRMMINELLDKLELLSSCSTKTIDDVVYYESSSFDEIFKVIPDYIFSMRYESNYQKNQYDYFLKNLKKINHELIDEEVLMMEES